MFYIVQVCICIHIYCFSVLRTISKPNRFVVSSENIRDRRARIILHLVLQVILMLRPYSYNYNYQIEIRPTTISTLNRIGTNQRHSGLWSEYAIKTESVATIADLIWEEEKGKSASAQPATSRKTPQYANAANTEYGTSTCHMPYPLPESAKTKNSFAVNWTAAVQSRVPWGGFFWTHGGTCDNNQTTMMNHVVPIKATPHRETNTK
jgi:hypothetical protein